MGREYARCLENGFEVERGRGALSKQGGNWDSGKQGGNKYKSCPIAFPLTVYNRRRVRGEAGSCCYYMCVDLHSKGSGCRV